MDELALIMETWPKGSPLVERWNEFETKESWINSITT